MTETRAAREALASLLAAHQMGQTHFGVECSCGDWKVAYRDVMYPERQHRAHLGDALMPLLAEREAAARGEALEPVRALLPRFEADYGIQSSPVSRLRAALSDREA